MKRMKRMKKREMKGFLKVLFVSYMSLRIIFHSICVVFRMIFHSILCIYASFKKTFWGICYFICWKSSTFKVFWQQLILKWWLKLFLRKCVETKNQKLNWVVLRIFLKVPLEQKETFSYLFSINSKPSTIFKVTYTCYS